MPHKVSLANVTDRLQEVERLRAERNIVANKMKGKLEPSERQILVEEGYLSSIPKSLLHFMYCFPVNLIIQR